MLTVTDGTNTAYLNFDDFTGTFKFASDGDHGTYVYDPPVGGSRDAPATATAAPGNDHATAPANQNGTGHAAGPVNEAGFLGNQDAATTATSHDAAAAPPANQLALAGDPVTAPPSATFAHGSGDLVAFDNDDLAGPTAGPAPGSVHNGEVTMTVTAVASPITVVATGSPVLNSEHLTDFDDRRRIGRCPQRGRASDGANGARQRAHRGAGDRHGAAARPLATLASASLGGSGNDSFAFHPNLGSDAAQNMDAHTSELAHNSVQSAAPRPVR